MKPFTVKTKSSDTGFRFFRIFLDGRKTTVSLDPVLVEQLDAILGVNNTPAWINITSNRVHNILVANADTIKHKSGLSRMVSREAWRFVLDPDFGHLDDLAKLNRTHPLKLNL